MIYSYTKFTSNFYLITSAKVSSDRSKGASSNSKALTACFE